MRSWILIGSLVLASCAPPAHLVQYQRVHEHEWTPIGALPMALQGMTEAQLIASMGTPIRSATSGIGSMELHHYEFCDAVRTFDAGQGPAQFVYHDRWRPVMGMSYTCGHGEPPHGFTLGRPVRVVVTNGTVTQVYY